jgi:plasmid replication initiation protein
VAGKQVDLFLDQLVDAPIKDERALMEFPFFSLQKQPRRTPFLYDDGKVKIRIEPSNKGMATIWDKDILIYLASLVNDRIERGAPVERTIQFAAYDFMRVTGRGTGKRAYELFLDALERLDSTRIRTTIEAGGDKERRGFGWVESWRVVERTNKKGERVMAGVEVTLNDWMFRAIVKDRRVLTINRDYFAIRKGLVRRLYELARKHVGYQPMWFIGLERLADKCGTTRDLRRFKSNLKKIIEDDPIPDYSLELVDASESPFRHRGNGLIARFTPKESAKDVEAIMPVKTKGSIKTPVLDAKPQRILMATYEEAQREYPGYDIDYLEQRWQGWTAGKGEQLKNPDKAFMAWCRTYTTNNPL